VELTPVSFGGTGEQDGLGLLLVLLGFLKRGFNLLPGETSSESMGLPIPVEGLERDKASNPQPKRGL
jgi:hypothetical protein